MPRPWLYASECRVREDTTVALFQLVALDLTVADGAACDLDSSDLWWFPDEAADAVIGDGCRPTRGVRHERGADAVVAPLTTPIHVAALGEIGSATVTSCPIGSPLWTF